MHSTLPSTAPHCTWHRNIGALHPDPTLAQQGTVHSTVTQSTQHHDLDSAGVLTWPSAYCAGAYIFYQGE